MERIVLKLGDERLGRRLPTGRALPKLDVLGKPFDKLNMRVRGLGNGYFCVVPHRVAVEVVIEPEFTRHDNLKIADVVEDATHYDEFDPAGDDADED